jgi:UDPglucose 6-dehydrogenase
LPRKSISIVGLGYVGLSTAACFAGRGFRVHGLDVDKERLEAIADGEPPLHEEGLKPLLARGLRDKLFTLSDEYPDALDTDVTFLSVGTPSAASGEINLAYVKEAAERLGDALKSKKGYHVVVVKSTVIPGTTIGLVQDALAKTSGKKIGAEIGLAMSPEFLREGSAVYDTMHPDALVIGAVDKKAAQALLSLYSEFYKRMPKTIITSPSNAEMIKYSVNTLRAIQLSSVNSLADMCSSVPGADMADVAKGLAMIGKLDPRYLRPGVGFGGSCLPKDTRALAAFAEATGAPSDMFRGALAVNLKQPKKVIELARKFVPDLKGRKVALLGLAFKAGTDDIRESVAIEMAKALIGEGAAVSTYDPAALGNAMAVLGSTVTYGADALECLKDAECCFLATEWQEFSKIKAATFVKLMKTPVVIDGRRVYDPVAFRRAGIKFARVGTSAE